MSNRRNLRKILYRVSLIVLIAAFTGSALIYRHAAAQPDDSSGYVVVGGFVYQADGLKSKRYIHDLQTFGGNGAVMADDFMHWFLGLWQGTSLAYTVAGIGAFASFVIFVIANNVEPGRQIGKNGDRR